MTLKTRNSAAHQLLTRILTRELIGRSDLAQLLAIDESMLERHESGERPMNLSLQWKLAAVVIASLSQIPEVRRRAYALRAQLIAVSAYQGGETETHASSAPSRFL
ncbi:MAG TPA: hypothetical protein VII52_05510 [Gemmatimonadaceae bacterium]